jgi:hypothetical protein
MQSEARVGKVAATVGTITPHRSTIYSGVVVQQDSGKYAEAVYNREVFHVCNQAAVAITAALATSYTGLVLGNAAGTGKNLVMLGCGYAATVAIPTATALGLMGGTMTAVASTLTPQNCYIGGAASIAWAEDSTTIGTPVLYRAFATAWTEATTAGTLSQPNWIDLDGSIIVPPGAFIAFYSTAANSAAFLLSFMWQEVAV